MSGDAPQKIRARLASGATVRSVFVKLAALEVVDLVHQAGLDAMVVDLEHSQLSDSEARRLVRHASALGLPAVVRLPSVDPGLINRLLEAGAAGIQLSTVTSRRQVEELIAACRFPPGGRRSLSLAHPAAGYGLESMTEHLAARRSGPIIVVQIETAKTDDPLPMIVSGTDVAFIGTTDLAVDLGATGPGDPVVDEVIGRIAAAVADAGPPTTLGGWAANAHAAGRLMDHGARYITWSSDLALLAGALRSEFPPSVAMDTDSMETGQT